MTKGAWNYPLTNWTFAYPVKQNRDFFKPKNNVSIVSSHHVHGPRLPGPDHDDDEEEEERLVLPHVQLAGGGARRSLEQHGAERRGQAEEQEGGGQDLKKKGKVKCRLKEQFLKAQFGPSCICCNFEIS